MNLMDDSNNESRVITGIITTVFPGVTIYENDVPEGFERPCFLIVRPDKTTTVRELTRCTYEETKTYTLFAFDELPDELNQNIEQVSKELESTKQGFIGYVMGTPKYLIPGSDRRYLTVEIVQAETDDLNAVITFTIRTKRTKQRDLRLPQYPPINKVVNNGIVVAETGKE